MIDLYSGKPLTSKIDIWVSRVANIPYVKSTLFMYLFEFFFSGAGLHAVQDLLLLPPVRRVLAGHPGGEVLLPEQLQVLCQHA